jgi:signal transduction histidine kinase
MRIVDSLEQIRPRWLSNVSHRLAERTGVRESLLDELNRFFDLLLQAVEARDASRLDPLLGRWVQARTQSEVETRGTSLGPLLEQILLGSYEVSREILEAEEALHLTGALLPVFSHAFGFTSEKETELHVQFVSRELEEAKTALEHLDESKSDFIAIAAHELKTPLTLIEGYLAILREQKPQLDQDPSAALLLRGVDKGTGRLRDIVDDMIDVSMIDNRLLALHFQPVWINRLLQVVKNDFSQIVEKRGLILELSNFPGSAELMFADEERLYQAFKNLVSNAIKYTPDGGKITIDGRQLPGFLEITFHDTGIGIDPEDQNHIFEKFGRIGSPTLHSSGKTKFKGGGPGLGLPITKGIVEAHGGAIWVESPGYDEANYPGTTFHVLLPQRKEPPDDKGARLFGPLVEEFRAQKG